MVTLLRRRPAGKTVVGLIGRIAIAAAAIAVAGLVSAAAAPAGDLPTLAAVAAAPSASITSPADNQVFDVDEEVPTTFSCAGGGIGPSAITLCVDSYGNPAPSGSLDTSDYGSYTYTVYAKNSAGETLATAEIHYTVGDAPPTPRTGPVNTSLPTIAGSATVGARLSASPGTWSGSAPLIYHYLWQRCQRACADISGATTSTYTTTSADAGATIRVVVFAMNRWGRASATSRAIGPVTSGHPLPSAAQIKARMLAQLAPYGRAAKIGTLLRKGGYPDACTVLIRGVMEISWYQVPKGAHLTSVRRPVLVATGKRSFSAAGKANMTVKLTKAGKQLLKHGKRVSLTAKGRFSPAGMSAVTALKAFTLKS